MALLVAEGRSNKEVAAALFLSPKTIEHHLGSVFRKRGFTSRSELVSAFARRPPAGLVTANRSARRPWPTAVAGIGQALRGRRRLPRDPSVRHTFSPVRIAADQCVYFACPKSGASGSGGKSACRWTMRHWPSSRR